MNRFDADDFVTVAVTSATIVGILAIVFSLIIGLFIHSNREDAYRTECIRQGYLGYSVSEQVCIEDKNEL